MFALQWEYLAGKAVAAQWDDRMTPEWPPHPDRVFQALVAAWGETGRDPAIRAALQWLECQSAPSLAAPAAVACSDRSVYVPVNDVEASARTKKYSDKMLALLPAQRNRQARSFPALTVSGTCTLIWSDAEPDSLLRASLADLCTRVTHIGHSSSLVRIWVCECPPRADWVPAKGRGEERLRVPHAGRLDVLVGAYANGAAERPRPPVAKWQAYMSVIDDGGTPVEGYFADDWLVYRFVASPRFGLAQTLVLTETFRKTLIAAAERVQSPIAKSLVSGHAADGKALAIPHLAYLPLGFVGHEHADGHLLGLAIVWPRGIDYETRDACLSVFAEAENRETGEITLNFTSGDRLTLIREEREVPHRTLTPETWCSPSLRWGTVTPIALDRMPSRRQGLADGWAARQIAKACERVGLPVPANIDVLPISRFSGVPACHDFPHLERRLDKAPRWHVHADILFNESVQGPLLLGAGRYRGYGFCRPLRERKGNALS